LVNLKGEVIGINTLIFNAPGSGIGFAIPSTMAEKISRQIVESGKVQRPYLGITMQPLTKELAQHFDLDDRDGAVVVQIAPNSPAAKANLKATDIIRAIDGRKMKNTNDVQKYVLAKDIGDEIRLEVLRNGKKKNILVKLERMPDAYGLAAGDIINPAAPEVKGEVEKLGFRVQELDKDTARSMGINEEGGLLVSSVKEKSAAAEGGLVAGDIITQVNGLVIESESDLLKAIKSGAKKNSSVFVVHRNGFPMFLVISQK
jgi:serine protease Do